MNRIIRLITLAGFLLVVAAGCRTSPIKNLNEATIPAASEQTPTLDEVTQRILSAGKKLGWSMNAERSGHIVGSLQFRMYAAIVDIPYNETRYSILYKDSANLKYDAETSTIDSSYGCLVRNLHASIQREFGKTVELTCDLTPISSSQRLLDTYDYSAIYFPY